MRRTTQSLRGLAWSSGAILALLVSAARQDALAQKHQDTDADKPFLVAKQGSFFVGGVKVQVPGVLDPFTTNASASDDGQIYHYDRLYAEYQTRQTRDVTR
jgi:hypothetical protein